MDVGYLWELITSCVMLWGAVVFVYAPERYGMLAFMCAICAQACLWVSYGAEYMACMLIVMEVGIMVLFWGRVMRQAGAQLLPQEYLGWGGMCVLWGCAAYYILYTYVAPAASSPFDMPRLGRVWVEAYHEVLLMLTVLIFIATLACVTLYMRHPARQRVFWDSEQDLSSSDAQPSRAL